MNLSASPTICCKSFTLRADPSHPIIAPGTRYLKGGHLVPVVETPYNRMVAGLGILFVCIGNSCRSPMAEAIARKLGNSRVEAHSAGIAPTGWIAEPTLTTLESLGYSNRGLWSKGLDAVPGDEIDVVVSLLGEQGLDFLPLPAGARREAWSIRDPYGEDEEVYLDVARRLEVRIRRLIKDELGGELPFS